MKKVSIVLPTYNGEKYIKESIESIINQTYTNWELIIVNDCSCDNTLNIINEYSKNDERIKIINNEYNQKLPKSLNNGFARATGEYYTWTSDDNMFKPKAIEFMVKYLDDNQYCDCISCNFDVIDENNNLLYIYSNLFPDRNPLSNLTACNIGACFLYRKELAQKAGEYDVSTFCAEDYDYWFKIILNGQVDYSSNNLYIYRSNSLSLSATKKFVILDKTNELRLKYALKMFYRFNLDKKKQVLILCNYFLEDENTNWLKLALNINPFLTLQITLLKYLQMMLFSIVNVGSIKEIRILGLKFKIKRKQK